MLGGWKKMMKHILGYRCTLCGAELPYDERMTCPHCGEKGILDIVFDYNYIKKSFAGDSYLVDCYYLHFYSDTYDSG